MPLVRYWRVVIFGYRSVEKTSLAHQFMEGEFLEGYDPTVENTYSKIVTLDKDEFHQHLVDAAGQDEHNILPYSFITGVHSYVLVYSVTSLHSFQVIESLYQKLHEGHGKICWLKASSPKLSRRLPMWRTPPTGKSTAAISCEPSGMG